MKTTSQSSCGRWFRRTTGALLAAVPLMTTSLFWSCGASAQTPLVTQRTFVVSAVLRRAGPGIVIKLIQSRVSASNTNEAISRLLGRVRKEYPGYTVLDTLTSQPEEEPRTCPEGRGFIAAEWPTHGRERGSLPGGLAHT